MLGWVLLVSGCLFRWRGVHCDAWGPLRWRGVHCDGVVSIVMRGVHCDGVVSIVMEWGHVMGGEEWGGVVCHGRRSVDSEGVCQMWQALWLRGGA